MEEVKFIDKIKLWEVVPRPNTKVISTRWVDVNKGDDQDMQVRSRLVARAVKKKGSVDSYFAATPPISSIKLLLSLAVTANLPTLSRSFVRKVHKYVLQFIDVKKAHFWGKAERVLCVELPQEYKDAHNLRDDVVGRLVRSMYGCRDAAVIWEKDVARVMFCQDSSGVLVLRASVGIHRET